MSDEELQRIFQVGAESYDGPVDTAGLRAVAAAAVEAGRLAYVVEQQNDFTTAVQIAKLADGKPDHSAPPTREEWMSPDEYCPHGRKHSNLCEDCERDWYLT